METKRKLTCIICPRGCEMEVTLSDQGNILSVDKNFCIRGAEYAKDECTHPKRTVTSTVACESGTPLPVKTKGTVPKERIFDVMAEINRAKAKQDAKLGDVIIQNVANTGIDVVATANASRD